MPCIYPISAWQDGVTKARKKRLVFKRPEGRDATPDIKVACGRCIECKLRRASNWAIRCVHEASLYEDNCFITLTYNEENIPYDFGLRKSDFQKFLKRLRRYVDKEYKGKRKIKYYMCGEYGSSENLRPHYHAIIFNYDFCDKLPGPRSDNGNPVYYSDILYNLWPLGNHHIGEATYESAAYIARYVTKKITGKDSKKHYERIDPETGEIFEVIPEYTEMSRGNASHKGKGNGIGIEWYKKYAKETYRDDYVIIRGKKMSPPSYYDLMWPDIQEVKEKRISKILEHPEKYSRERLQALHKIRLATLKTLPRRIEK